MKGLRERLFLLGAVGLLLGVQTLRAQETEGCLRPTRLNLMGPPGLLSPDHDRPEEAIFLSPDGRLCQSFSPTKPFLTPNQSIQEQTLSPARAFLLSSVLPGTGQRFLGQDRWVAYLAAEVWAWAQYLGRRGEGRELQDRYKDLAWLVARRVSSGPRVDGSFEYYEALTQYPSSGAYDIDPDELGVQPELDPETFNGSIWELAREIFFLDDPETPVEVGSDHYKKALRYYLSRAYTPVFAWNWSNNTLQQQEFSQLIRNSDENLRRSTTMVGVILANHLLSAVDALVTGRLLQEGAMDPILQISLLPAPYSRNAVAFSVSIPTR